MENCDYIKNVGILGGNLNLTAKNVPGQYSSRKRQYLGNESNAFIKQYAKYSSDFFSAMAQGLVDGEPETWTEVSIRMADIVSQTSIQTRKADDFKVILVGDEWVEYIKQGTKFKTMGSTWLCIDPQNISGSFGSALVERCNAVWNHLDWYGNILSEPLSVDGIIEKANANDPQNTTLIAKGYFNVKCQYNKWTAQLNTNSRLILGSGAYAITGYSDFAQEFTGDYSSVNMLEFTIRHEEPNFEIDDMENHVAGGKTFSWEVSIEATPSMVVGGAMRCSASSFRCGEPADDLADYPVTYVWDTSNKGVATIDGEGNVTAISAGTCSIVCWVAQNPALRQTCILTVEEAGSETGSLTFTETPPASLNAYESAEISCLYLFGGGTTTNKVTWTFSGADENAYSAVISGNTVSVGCWGGSETPLIITASCNGSEISCEIALNGI